MVNVAIIPARGGSKGIPRKNIRLLDGKPLISYVINAAKNSKYIDVVVVSTDDEEIRLTAEKYGVEVLKRPDELANDEVPLDPVIYYALKKLESDGLDIENVATIQPTSPLLKAETIDKVFEKLITENRDTVLTAIDDRHLSWSYENGEYKPNYSERKNRQYLPSEYRETGAVLVSRRRVINEFSRIGRNVTLFEVSKEESIDIDSPTDWWVAEKLLKQKTVIIRVDGYKDIGLGHIFRTLTIANQIIDHKLIFLMNQEYRMGIDLVKSQNFRIELFDGKNAAVKIIELKPDIVINDILNTEKDYILQLKNAGIKVFNFEDLGEGAEYADGVFNALYPGRVPSNHFYTGEKYYCARPDFIDADINPVREKVSNILLTYGGADPNNLTLRTLETIANMDYEFKITIIVGPGYTKINELKQKIKLYNKEIVLHQYVRNMAEFMLDADVIFSSAGRTMYEIAMVGTPAIIIAQNSREMTHLFGHNYNGFINLGLHMDVDSNDIRKSLTRLINDKEMRLLMNRRMLKHDLRKGLERVFSIIFK